MYRIPLFLFALNLSSVAQAQDIVTFKSSNSDLTSAFDWAKNKALSYAHDASDPVGYWYEAALPNREAFCMRDVSHQAIGAEILGLTKHNENMFQKFAENIGAEKDYCSYWEINRYNKPAPVDYNTDKDFWYNLPANFDVVYNAWRVYNWNGNKIWFENEALKRFYTLSMNEYLDHWKLGYDQVTKRSRSMFVEFGAGKFGNNRGIPTYNEGGRGEVFLGIDQTASIIAAYKAYAEILKQTDRRKEANKYQLKAEREQEFLEEFWWDSERKEYRSIQYTDKSFDYFMIEKDQAYLHYLLYFNAIDDPTKIKNLTEQYRLNYNNLIVELKSYLPIIFYENGYSTLANNIIVELCSAENKRRDYPENSFTIIEHITRGLMGIEAEASANKVSTISRLDSENDWAEMDDVPILSNKISVKHVGLDKTIFTNKEGPSLMWTARMPGDHKYIFVNGINRKAFQGDDHGRIYSFYNVEVKAGSTVTVSFN
ncbi:MAG: hypothetical protein U5K54_12715 [Cytophagales bacterium]|nr:hypothetical protein [Cytophagales bacterium]